MSVQVAEGTNTLTISLANGYKTTRKIYSQKEEEVKPNTIEEDNKKEEIKLILKSLKIEGYDITPEFSPEVYEYTLNIPEEDNYITKLNIEAIGDKENFTVEINGNDELSDGENVITILVKSPDTEKIATYKIKVIKEAKAVEVSTNIIEEVDDANNVKDKKSSNILTIGVVAFTTIVAVAGIVFAVVEYRYGKHNKDDELGSIPYSNIGFEKNDIEEDKEDILKETSKEETSDNAKEEKINDNFIEELYNKKTDGKDIDNEIVKPKKKGKHF